MKGDRFLGIGYFMAIAVDDLYTDAGGIFSIAQHGCFVGRICISFGIPGGGSLRNLRPCALAFNVVMHTISIKTGMLAMLNKLIFPGLS